jgi:hypothetical protein
MNLHSSRPVVPRMGWTVDDLGRWSVGRDEFYFFTYCPAIVRCLPWLIFLQVRAIIWKFAPEPNGRAVVLARAAVVCVFSTSRPASGSSAELRASINHDHSFISIHIYKTYNTSDGISHHYIIYTDSKDNQKKIRTSRV